MPGPSHLLFYYLVNSFLLVLPASSRLFLPEGLQAMLIRNNPPPLWLLPVA